MGIQTASQALVNESGGSPFGFKNRIINGAMVIDQRNAGASHTPTDGYSSLDRSRFAIAQSSKITAQQNQGSVTPPTGFTNYIGITSSSAYTLLSTDYFLYQQRLEGYNVSDLDFGLTSAKYFTISFWVRSSLTGTFSGTVSNSAYDRNYTFTYVINQANTWEYKTITLRADTTGTWLKTNGIGLSINWSLGAGSNYTTSTLSTFQSTVGWKASGAVDLVSTNGATWYITGVQLEVGSQATSFDYRPYGTEFALCQRYYFKDVAQVQYQGFCTGVVYSTSLGQPIYKYPTTMRSSPTIVYANLQMQSGATSVAISSTSLARAGLNTVELDLNTSGFTSAGSAMWLRDDGGGTGYISGSAEL